jgi:hypothetical protein
MPFNDSSNNIPQLDNIQAKIENSSSEILDTVVGDFSALKKDIVDVLKKYVVGLDFAE